MLLSSPTAIVVIPFFVTSWVRSMALWFTVDYLDAKYKVRRTGNPFLPEAAIIDVYV